MKEKKRLHNYFTELINIFTEESKFKRFLLFWANYVVLINIINTIFLIYHTSLIAIYSIINTLFVVYLRTLIKKDNYNFFIRCMYINTLLYIVVMTLSFGFNSGFQNLMFAILVAFFIPFFLPHYAKMSKKIVGNYSVVYFIVYIILLFITSRPNFQPIEYIKEPTANFFYVYNSVITFSAIILLTYFYINRSNYFRKVLTKRSDYDELTSIYNRYAINKMLDTIINENGKKVSLAILDIDYFKKINDTYGHLAGDKILENLANILHKHARKKYVYVGRWGGEEFIIATDKLSYKEFIEFLENLRTEIESSIFNYDDKDIKMTVSIGAYKYSSKLSKYDLIKKADNNLYEAKEKGRNKVIS